jgi:ribose transport system permease protein
MIKIVKQYQSTLVQWLGLFFVIVVFWVWSKGNLFSAYNLNTMLETVTPLVIVCSGMTFIFAHGGMDISSGAVVAISSLTAVSVMNRTNSLVLGVITSVVIAIVCYMINVVVTNKFGLMAVITSLAIMFSARGLVTYICQQTPNDSISVASVNMNLFKKDHTFMVLLMVVFVLVLSILFRYTKLGKGAKAIGDNQIAARQNGVRVDLYKMLCYMVAGISVGTAALFKLGAVGKVQSTTGNGFEMDILIVVVLGGMSLSGGASTRLSSAVVGSFTYVLLLKGLTIVGMNPNFVILIKAIVFLTIIYITSQRTNLKTMPK